VKAWRITLATAGLLLGLFGVYRLFTEIPLPSLVVLGVWLLAALLVHDGLVSPAVYLRGSQPAVKALLLRNYGLNLTLILGLIAVITLSLYAIRVARDSSSAESGDRD
jgi:hypothetical protein